MGPKTGITVLLLSCGLLCFGFASSAPAGRRLWVVKEPGEILEYDPATWAVLNTIKVPVEVVKDPGSLDINNKGQMLFCPMPSGALGPQGFAASKIWFWDGRTAVFLDRGATHKSSPATRDNSLAVESTPRCTLSGDGTNLYWFENEFRTLENADGLGVSVSTTFRAWQSDLTGGHRTPIAQYSFPPCDCTTGTCSESCPEADFWFPDAGVDNFFIVTHWIPGQIGTTYQSSFLYRQSDGKWFSRKLPQVMEELKDAVQGGATLIYALPDGGCCGWENESNDQTFLSSDGKDMLIFDERQRYANPDYDVSFFTSNARFSPDARMIAMTIVSTAQPGTEVRLSDGGKPNPGQLARINRSIADLPEVEVLSPAVPPQRIALLPHATLAGWLNGKEILVVENGVLEALDVQTGTLRKSQLKVAKESQVFVR